MAGRVRWRVWRRGWAALLGGWLALAGPGLGWGAPPAVSLAKVYEDGRDPTGYWVSEKLDGVRGYWDGSRLLTRAGNPLVAPAWFTAGWPGAPMEGELWVGRGRFEETVAIVRAQTPDDSGWRRVRFMLFDLPAHPGPFTERLAALQAVAARIDRPWVQAIPQLPATSAQDLRTRLGQVVGAGGEGLMLHRGDALYQAGRSDDVLKYKPYLDGEARVIAHLPGQGRHAGRLGALQVETEDGRRFRLGSGFSDQVRRDPPPLGAWVTYRYKALSARGIPRFASYWRVRADREAPPPQPE